MTGTQCPHCGQSHPAGTTFCSATGRPFRRSPPRLRPVSRRPRGMRPTDRRRRLRIPTGSRAAAAGLCATRVRAARGYAPAPGAYGPPPGPGGYGPPGPSGTALRRDRVATGLRPDRVAGSPGRWLRSCARLRRSRRRAARGGWVRASTARRIWASTRARRVRRAPATAIRATAALRRLRPAGARLRARSTGSVRSPGAAGREADWRHPHRGLSALSEAHRHLAPDLRHPAGAGLAGQIGGRGAHPRTHRGGRRGSHRAQTLSQRTAQDLQRQLQETDPKKREALARDQQKEMQDLQQAWATTGTAAVGGRWQSCSAWSPP